MISTNKTHELFAFGQRVYHNDGSFGTQNSAYSHAQQRMEVEWVFGPRAGRLEYCNVSDLKCPVCFGSGNDSDFPCQYCQVEE